MSGVCYIVGAGEIYGSIQRRGGDLVIAADGGYDALCKMGITPDVLIGDMDSISSVPHLTDTITVPAEKDETDTYLCYLEGVRRGYDDFVILGGVGGRDDHTFANYSLLIGAICNKKRVTIIGERFDIFAIKDEKYEICGRCGAMLSVFAFGADAEGVCISGCKYSADNITLRPTFALGVSNEICDECAAISVARGTLLIMLERREI